MMPTLGYPPAMDAEGLKAWMDETGWSVRKLAARLGVEARTVQRWRDGSSRVPPMAELALQALGPAPRRESTETPEPS